MTRAVITARPAAPTRARGAARRRHDRRPRRASSCPRRCSPRPAAPPPAASSTSSSTSPTIGAVVTKSIMLAPRSGRPTPRMAETPSGMLNSIGLQGPGIDAFLDKDLAWLRERGARAVVSIAGGTRRRVHQARRASCATSATSRPSRSTSRAPTSRAAARCSPATPSRPPTWSPPCAATPRPGSRCFAKLSPDVTDIVEIAALGRRRRRRRPVDDQHAARHGHRHRHDAPGAGRASPAGCPARRSDRSRCAASTRCTPAMPDVPILGMGGIRPASTRCEFVLAGRQRRQRRHGDLPRPVGARPRRARARGRAGRARLRVAARRRRLRPPRRPTPSPCPAVRSRTGHGRVADADDELEAGAEG